MERTPSARAFSDENLRQLISCLRLHRQIAVRTKLRAQPRVQQTNKLINLRHRPHGAFAAAASISLLDAYRWRQPLNPIHVRTRTLLHKLPRIRACRIQKPPLPLRIKQIKSQSAFARTAHPRNHDKSVPRNLNGNIPQIMLPRALNGNPIFKTPPLRPSPPFSCLFSRQRSLLIALESQLFTNAKPPAYSNLVLPFPRIPSERRPAQRHPQTTASNLPATNSDKTALKLTIKKDTTQTIPPLLRKPKPRQLLQLDAPPTQSCLEKSSAQDPTPAAIALEISQILPTHFPISPKASNNPQNQPRHPLPPRRQKGELLQRLAATTNASIRPQSSSSHPLTKTICHANTNSKQTSPLLRQAAFPQYEPKEFLIRHRFRLLQHSQQNRSVDGNSLRHIQKSRKT